MLVFQQPSLACLPSTYASNRSVAATTTLLLFSLLPFVPLTVPFCRQKCCKFELNCESPTTALINFLLDTASALTKVYHFCRSKNLSIYGGKLYFMYIINDRLKYFLIASHSLFENYVNYHYVLCRLKTFQREQMSLALVGCDMPSLISFFEKCI